MFVGAHRLPVIDRTLQVYAGGVGGVGVGSSPPLVWLASPITRASPRFDEAQAGIGAVELE